MKWNNVRKKLWRYIRHDFREIAWPSSLPDPPSLAAKKRRLTLQDHKDVWRAALRDYFKSWRGPIRDPREEQKRREARDEEQQATLVEDLAVAARAGAEGVKPLLQRMYMARASAYRDALREFVVGYQEGLAEAMRPKPQSQGLASISRDTEQQTATTPGSEHRERSHDGRGQ